MKALSVKQPWANFIASGKKTIETRRWATDFRGDILIVSAKQPRIEPAGFALALVRLAECRPMTLSDESAALCEVYESAIAWVLRDIRPLRPFRVTGQRGLFDVALDASLLVQSADTLSVHSKDSTAAATRRVNETAELFDEPSGLG